MWGKKWFAETADLLSAQKQDSYTGTFFLLFGEETGFEFLISGVEAGPVALVLVFDEGEDSTLLRKRLLEDPEIQELMKLLHVRPDMLEVTISAVKVSGPEEWFSKKAPEAAKLAQFIQLLGRRASARAGTWSRNCWTCFEREAALTLVMDNLCRRCLSCSGELEKFALKAAELQGENPAEEELGLLLDPNLDGEDMLQKGRELREAFERSPQWYWRKLLLWVALGQFALAAGLFVLLGVGGGLLFLFYQAVINGKGIAIWVLLKLLLSKGLKLVLVIGLAVAGLWGSLVSWFRRPSQDKLRGVTLSREKAPNFFAWVDGISEELKAPKVDLLVVDDSVNASASEKRLKGGQYRKVVTVGVPLLEICSVEELKSIIAHELAHICHDDPKSRFIYRTMQSWNRIAHSTYGETGFASFGRFSNWFIPRFLVRAQVLVRAAERQADKAARTVVSKDVQARELIKIHVVSRLFWSLLAKNIVREVVNDSGRHFLDFTLESLRKAPKKKLAEAYQEALEEKPHWLDSHPCLAEQFRILEMEPPEELDMDLEPEPPAKELVDNYSEVRVLASAELQAKLTVQLEEYRFLRLGENRRLEQLATDLEEEPSPARRFAWARFLNRTDRDEEAVVALLRVLEEQPEHKDAVFELTSLLTFLERQEEAAERLSEYFSIEEETEESYLWSALSVFQDARRDSELNACIERLLELGQEPASVRYLEGLRRDT